MRLAKRCGMRLHECDAHLEYARLALAEGKPDAALPHFQSVFFYPRLAWLLHSATIATSHVTINSDVTIINSSVI